MTGLDVNTILNMVIVAAVVGGLGKLFQIEKRLARLESIIEEMRR